MVIVRPADPAEPRVAALIAYHHAGANAAIPDGFAYALTAEALSVPDVALFAAWAGDDLAGIGAIKRISAEHAELKSMRTHPDHLRKGVAAAILARLIEAGRGGGYRRLSLETGVTDAFAPALALYRRFGFVDAAPFGDYRASPHNRFMTLVLE